MESVLQTIIDEAGIPVLKKTYAEFVDFCLINDYPIPSKNCRGRYYPHNSYALPFIIIRKELSIEAQIGTILHELGHHACHNRRCGCYIHSLLTCELHATCYAISAMIIKNLAIPLAYELNELHKFAVKGKQQLRTRLAKSVMNMPLYQRACRSAITHLPTEQRHRFDELRKTAHAKLPLNLKRKLQSL